MIERETRGQKNSYYEDVAACVLGVERRREVMRLRMVALLLGVMSVFGGEARGSEEGLPELLWRSVMSWST